MIKISVIIPTYHDWDRLKICIKALEQQTLSKDQFEVIVINNDPQDKLPEGFNFPLDIKIINESQKGSYAARNAGINVAQGELLAFTDSDCLPSKNWLKEAIRCFEENPNVDRIGGKVELTILGDKPNLAEAYELIYAFKQEEHVSIGAAITANMVTKRKVFDDVGGFNQKLYSGGDIEWGLRANSKGYKIVFSSEVLVKHPARYKIKQITGKTKRVAALIGAESLTKRYKKLIVLIILPHLFFFREGKYISLQKTNLGSVDIILVLFFRYYLKILFHIQKLKLHYGAKQYQDV